MNANVNDFIASIYNQFLNFINSGSDDAVIDNAKRILSLRLKKKGINALEDFNSVKEYLILWFANEDAVKFCCIYLDQEHRFIQCQNVFFGSIKQCEKHIKEISRTALMSNASSVIFSNNVRSLTDYDTSCIKNIKIAQDALTLIDVRVIDHLFICGSEHFSLKEEGLL